MNGLRAALQSRYSDRADEIKIYTPRNCDPVLLTFRADRTAKVRGQLHLLCADLQVIGSLAAKPPAPEKTIDGLLVYKDFSYTVLAPQDLAEFTGLGTSTIVQRQRVTLNVGWELVRWHLEGMYGKVEEGVDLEGVRTLRVMNVVDIKQPTKHELVLEWVASVSNDMVADSVIALLLGIDSCPATVKMTMQDHACAHQHEKPEQDEEAAVSATHAAQAEQVSALLEAHFGQVEMVDIGGRGVPEQAPEASAPKQQEDEAEAGEQPAEQPAEQIEQPAEQAGEPSDSSAPATPPADLAASISGPLRPALHVSLDEEPAYIELDKWVRKHYLWAC